MITSLTKEQEAQIEIYFQRYLKIGLDLTPINHDKVTELVKQYYILNKMASPEVKFFSSPMACEQEINRINKTQYTYNGTWFFGQWDSYWLGYYKYIEEVLKQKLNSGLKAKFDLFHELSTQINLMYCFEGLCLLSEKPIRLSKDAEGRGHNLTEAAIEYPDGYSVFLVHGTRVPAWIIKTPEKITPKLIDKEENLEIARVMLDIFGQQKYLLESKFEVLDEDIDSKGAKRRLLRKQFKDHEAIVRVEVKNSTPEPDGSIKTYFLPVHPELRPLINAEKREFGEPQELTCKNAVASTFGERGADYANNGSYRQGDVYFKCIDGRDKRQFNES